MVNEFLSTTTYWVFTHSTRLSFFAYRLQSFVIHRAELFFIGYKERARKQSAGAACTCIPLFLKRGSREFK